MTKSEMDKIEQAYDILLKYELEVKEFLLYVCGFHNFNENDWVETSKVKIQALTSQSNDRYILGALLSNLQNVSGKETERLLYLQNEFLRVVRNSKEWLNSAGILLGFYTIR